MHVLVYVPLAASLLAAASAWPLADRLPPRAATWLLTLGAVVIAGTSCAALGLLAMAAALRLRTVDALGGMSLAVASHLDPAPLAVGIVAGGLFGAAALAAMRAAWLRTAALVSAHRDARRLAGDGHPAGDGRVVTIADDSADAYAVPGLPGRIVVTSGMLDALSAAEREVLLAHERAHVSACHYLFAALVRLSAAANPLLRPMAAAVGYTLERWADERAAAVTGNRPLVARAIASAALASAAGRRHRAGSAVLAGLTGSSPPGRPGSVPRRVDALLGPPPRRNIILLVVVIALVAGCGLAALDAARDLHAIVEFAQSAALP